MEKYILISMYSSLPKTLWPHLQYNTTRVKNVLCSLITYYFECLTIF